jgi:hypothetical protein
LDLENLERKKPLLMMSFGTRIFLFQLCEVEKVTITDVKKTPNFVETALKNQKPPRCPNKVIMAMQNSAKQRNVAWEPSERFQKAL